MATRPAQFGAALGGAIAGGAQSISEGIQKRYLQEYLAAQKKADEAKAKTQSIYEAYISKEATPMQAEQWADPRFRQAQQRGTPPPLGQEQVLLEGKPVSFPEGYGSAVEEHKKWLGEQEAGRGRKVRKEEAEIKYIEQYKGRSQTRDRMENALKYLLNLEKTTGLDAEQKSARDKLQTYYLEKFGIKYTPIPEEEEEEEVPSWVDELLLKFGGMFGIGKKPKTPKTPASVPSTSQPIVKPASVPSTSQPIVIPIEEYFNVFR